MTVDELRIKRAETAEQRATFIAQAERQIAALDGALAMLDALIAEMETAVSAGDGADPDGTFQPVVDFIAAQERGVGIEDEGTTAD